MIANPVQAMAAGAQYADQLRQARTNNALAQLYQSQGAGIANGDQGAINALAGLDPQAAMTARNNALSYQNTQQSMAFDAEKMQMLREDAKNKAAEHAASLTEADRKAQADKLSSVLSGAASFYSKGDRAGYDNFLRGQNIDPAQYPFDQFEATAASVSGVLDALTTFDKRNAPAPGPEWSAATPEQAAQYGAAAGQINTKTGEFKPINPPSGMSVTTNPDGTMSLVQGPGAGAAKPLTEAEGKNAGYLIRLKDAGATLDQLEAQGTDLGATVLSMDPTGLSNYAQSPQYQMYDQAKRDFVNAILRRESGAVISPSEFASAEKQYFPAPGDSPEVIAQKRKNRTNALAGVSVGSGQGVNNPAVSGSDGVSAGGDYSKMDISQLTAVDVGKLNANEKAALSARLKELGF